MRVYILWGGDTIHQAHLWDDVSDHLVGGRVVGHTRGEAAQDGVYLCHLEQVVDG